MRKAWANLYRYARPLLGRVRRGSPMIMALGGLFLLAAIWWWGPHWRWGEHQPLASLTGRVLATVLLVLVPLLAWSLRLRYRYRRLEAERALEARRQEDPCLRHVQAQERALDQTLANLLGRLRGRNRVYQLPWYLVLGQERSGKTSFVNRSDQRFTLTGELKASHRSAQDDPDLIYSVDWWMGDKAVLIDPPGELITQPHADEPAAVSQTEDGQPYAAVDAPRSLPPELNARLWRSLIGWLGRKRSRRPLNGVMLMVSLDALLNQSASDRRALAMLLRTRLIDLSQTLGTRPPLYVVLSKFDLLEGFEVLFARLSRSDREELFGFTFTLDSVKNYDAWLPELSESFEQLVQHLQERVFDTLPRVAELKQREALYSFVRQLTGIRHLLTRFLTDILGSDRYATPALPRGVYFSSVHQQGLLSNAYLNATSRSYHLTDVTMPAQPGGRSVVYFAQRVFQEIVYPEAGLVGDNVNVIARKKRTLVLSSVAAFTTFSAFTGAWYHYHGVNRAKVVSVLERSRAFSAHAIDGKVDQTGLNLLRPLNQIRSAVTVYDGYRASWPVLADMGLYQGREIGPKVDEAYLNLLSRRFLPELASGMVATMEAPDTSGEAKLAALRAYRMIEDRANRRPKLVENWMATQWQATLPGKDGAQRALMGHLDYALQFVDVQLPQFRTRVAQVQRDLRQIPLPQRIYMTLRQQSEDTLRTPLDLRNEIGPAFDIVYQTTAVDSGPQAANGVRIDALLTAKGYRGFFLPHSEDLTEMALVDQWALGERRDIDYSSADKRALAERVRAIYSRDYIDSWQRGLNRLEVRDFIDLTHAVSILGSVTGPAAPLRRLVETVRDNSDFGAGLTDVPAGAGASAVEGVKPVAAPQKDIPQPIQGIAHTFAPLSQLLVVRGDKASYLDETMAAVGSVYDTVKRVQDSPSQGKAALGVVLDRFAMKGNDPVSNLQRIAIGLPEPLNLHVGKLASESAQIVLIEALGEVERRWDSEVYRFYDERLASRYPFNPASRDDVSLDDFTTFFGPQGTLQQFREKYLNVFLQENLEALYSARTGGSLVRNDVLTQLATADKIRDAFFNSAGQLRVQFMVEPLGLTPTKRSSSLSLDGQVISYNHGPTVASNLIWPNTLANQTESRITLVNDSGNSSSLVYRGGWAMFRLLSMARLNGATASRVDLSFLASDGGMRYRITADKPNNPFSQPLFKGFALPRTLLQARIEPTGAGVVEAGKSAAMTPASKKSVRAK